MDSGRTRGEGKVLLYCLCVKPLRMAISTSVPMEHLQGSCALGQKDAPAVSLAGLANGTVVASTLGPCFGGSRGRLASKNSTLCHLGHKFTISEKNKRKSVEEHLLSLGGCGSDLPSARCCSPATGPASVLCAGWHRAQPPPTGLCFSPERSPRWLCVREKRPH